MYLVISTWYFSTFYKSICIVRKSMKTKGSKVPGIVFCSTIVIFFEVNTWPSDVDTVGNHENCENNLDSRGWQPSERKRKREREAERSLKLHSGCSVNSKLTHYPVASLRKRACLSLEWCRRDSTTGTKNLREFSDILKKYIYIFVLHAFLEFFI